MKNKTSILAGTWNFFYALLIVVIFCGCGNGENSVNGEIQYRTEVIDNCEYIVKYNGYQRGYMFSHKGNCIFCAERSKK